jgi:DUF2927 family protein
MTTSTGAIWLKPLCRRIPGCAALIVGVLILTGALPDQARAEDPEISARRATERKSFTDGEIINGFFKVAFGAEMRLRGKVDRIRKYDGPVRVYVDSRAKPDRRVDVAKVIADIATRINYLDIAMTANRREANVIVTLVRDRDFGRAVRAVYGRDRAKRIARSLDPQCLSGFRKDEGFRIVNSNVILVVDAGDFIFFDCAYEEILQSLGPINDTSVPWTMFNDDVQMGFFDVYDQYLLNILYDPRIRPGMRRKLVRRLMPGVLASVRRWVGRTNNLTP